MARVYIKKNDWDEYEVRIVGQPDATYYTDDYHDALATKTHMQIHQQKPQPKTLELTFYTDPGHGWLKVRKADVDALGVRVSGYSYISPKGSYLYLEEDCDAPAFLRAAEGAGWTVIHEHSIHSNSDSFIRRYRRTV